MRIILGDHVNVEKLVKRHYLHNFPNSIINSIKNINNNLLNIHITYQLLYQMFCIHYPT